MVIVSPEGTFGLDELEPVLAAERPKSSGSRGRERRTKRALKDLRQWMQQRRFAERAVLEVKKLGPVPFVLTRHVLFGTAGLAGAAALGVPVVSWIHAALVAESTSWGNRRFAPGWVEQLGERRLLQKADLRVAVTDKVLTDLDLHGPKSFPAGNGTLLQRFEGQGQRSPRVVWVGSFRGFHGIDTIVRAFDGVPGELVLVGRGSQLSVIEDLVVDRGLTGCVELPGFVAPLDLPGVLTGCQVGVVASGVDLSEFHYSPVKLREYAAAGLVVCLPAVGEMAALANEPWVVAHDNSESGLRAAMTQALERAQDPTVGASARAYADEHYSWVPWWSAVLDALGTGRQHHTAASSGATVSTTTSRL